MATRINWKYNLVIFGLLMVIWVIFSGLLDAFHLSLGVFSCAVVTWMSADLFFNDRSKSAEDRQRELFRTPGYLLWLMWEIVLANVHVLRLALLPGGMKEVEPEIVEFKTVLKSEFAKWVFANSITLTPGTVTLYVQGDTFLVHAISKGAAEGLRGEMERRIAEVFEPEALT